LASRQILQLNNKEWQTIRTEVIYRDTNQCLSCGIMFPGRNHTGSGI